MIRYLYLALYLAVYNLNLGEVPDPYNSLPLPCLCLSLCLFFKVTLDPPEMAGNGTNSLPTDLLFSAQALSPSPLPTPLSPSHLPTPLLPFTLPLSSSHPPLSSTSSSSYLLSRTIRCLCFLLPVLGFGM